MATKSLKNGAWEEIDTLKVPVSGAYQEADHANALVSGAWQEVWSSFVSPYKLVDGTNGTVDKSTGICTIHYTWSGYGGNHGNIGIEGEFKSGVTYLIRVNCVALEPVTGAQMRVSSSDSASSTDVRETSSYVIDTKTTNSDGHGALSFIPRKDLNKVYFWTSSGGPASQQYLTLQFNDVTIKENDNEWLCDY